MWLWLCFPYMICQNDLFIHPSEWIYVCLSLTVLFSLINVLCKAFFCDLNGRDSSHVVSLFCNSPRVVCVLKQWFKTTHLHMEERSSGNVQPPQKIPPSHSYLQRPHAMTARHAHVYLPIAACARGKFKETSLQWFGFEQCCQIFLEKQATWSDKTIAK